MLLEVSNITKFFPGQEASVLDRVSFALGEGERVGIIGPSGSGKSTLARIIARLERADAGSVTFNGATVRFGDATIVAPQNRAPKLADPVCSDPVHHANPSLRSLRHPRRPSKPSRAEQRQVRAAWLDMQMVFQDPAASFSDHMPIGKAIWEGAAYHPAFAQFTSEDREEKVGRTLEIVGLDRSFAAKRAFELSGGEAQRASIARAIIGDPKLIICDEATSALDVTVQARIMDLLKHLYSDHGMAILFISHDLALVQNFCDRIYSL